MIVTGKYMDRIIDKGIDLWGCYVWSTLRGSHDEGVLIITAYRVYQTKGTSTGPSTAFMQQVDGLLKEELGQPLWEPSTPIKTHRDIDPRKQILNDLRFLIETQWQHGFHPILMWDANDDWMDKLL